MRLRRECPDAQWNGQRRIECSTFCASFRCVMQERDKLARFGSYHVTLLESWKHPHCRALHWKFRRAPLAAARARCCALYYGLFEYVSPLPCVPRQRSRHRRGTTGILRCAGT